MRGVIPAKGISELPFTVTIRKPDFSSREFAPHKHKEFELALFIDGSGSVDIDYDAEMDKYYAALEKTPIKQVQEEMQKQYDKFLKKNKQ